MKKLLTVFATYGKADGEEIVSRGVINDDSTARTKAVADWLDTDMADESEVAEFVEGKVDFVSAGNAGDWDEPTGYSIVIETEAKALEVLKENYEAEVEKIKDLLKRG